MVILDIEYPYQDQVSLNNTNSNLYMVGTLRLSHRRHPSSLRWNYCMIQDIHVLLVCSKCFPYGFWVFSTFKY